MFQKNELRKIYLEKRKQLSSIETEQKSKKIHDWLFSRFMIHRYTNIHVFLPIKKQNEIDTCLIINTLKKDFPINIIISKSLPDGTLSHCIYDDATVLEENRWGIPEPLEPFAAVNASEIDMVLVPLLVFDKHGHRVGYGKGYYDRFLATCRDDILKVGLSFFEPVEAIADVSALDIRLDYCITPERIWKF